MIVKNKTKNSIIASNVRMADSFFSRLIGLMSRLSLSDDEGLVITRCNSINMFFMRFAIDVIFVSKNHKVVGLLENIKPWRMSRIYSKSSYCIELPSGKIAQKGVSVDDELDIS